MTDYNRKLSGQEERAVERGVSYVRKALDAANGKLEDYFSGEDHLRDAIAEQVIDGCDADISAEIVADKAALRPSWEYEPQRLVVEVD